MIDTRATCESAMELQGGTACAHGGNGAFGRGCDTEYTYYAASSIFCRTSLSNCAKPDGCLCAGTRSAKAASCLCCSAMAPAPHAWLSKHQATWRETLKSRYELDLPNCVKLYSNHQQCHNFAAAECKLRSSASGKTCQEQA